MLEREGRQPAFAADGPALIGGLQEVGGVKTAERHLDLVAAAREDGGATGRAEEAPAIALRLPLDHHCLLGKDRRAAEERAVMLAAVEAMAETHPIGPSRRHEPQLPAKASAGELRHGELSLPASGNREPGGSKGTD